MAKYESHGLKETENMIQLRGIVNGTQKNTFFKDGIGSNKNGISVNFGVEINERKTVYVTLTAYPKQQVYYYKRGENGQKGTSQAVDWKNRDKSPGEGFGLIGMKLSTGKDDEGNNINKIFVEYDAVNWLHENLKDGDSVFIKGKIEPSSYVKDGQTIKRVNIVPDQISYTKKPIDFEAEDFKELCDFENTLIFNSIDKETDENNKATGRYILSGYSIDYRSVETMSFIIEEEHATLATNLKKHMKPGYAIQTFGRINVVNNIVVTEEEDSGWGESSPLEKANGPVLREYVVYKAVPSTIDKETWSEEDIAAAIRKLKAAKEARANFGEKPTIDTSAEVDDWGDMDDDDDVPWNE